MQASAPTRTLACLVLLLGLSACDKGSSEGEPSKDEDAAVQADGDKPAAAAAVTEAQVKTFLKEQRKKACEMLPPAMVAKALDVPEGELKQMKIAGCIYSWSSADDSQEAKASLTTIFVDKDIEAAQQRLEKATRSISAEEAKGQLAVVTDMTKEHESIDSAPKEQAVDQVGGLIGAMIPDEGYQYEDVAGVGDAARVLTHDGTLTVRVGNMVFTVSAYKGAAAPPIDLAGIAPTDMKAIMAVSKAAETKWMEQTRELRRQQAIELAKVIVAAL